MESDELKQPWQQQTFQTHLSKEELGKMLRGRTNEIRQKIRKRLTASVASYVFLLLLMLSNLFDSFKLSKLLYFGWALLVLGLLIAIVLYRSRQINAVDMGRTMEESLSNLIDQLGSTMKVYLRSYVVFLTSSLIFAAYLIGSRYVENVLVPLMFIALAFSVWSGKTYLNRFLGQQKAQLEGYLEELRR